MTNMTTKFCAGCGTAVQGTFCTRCGKPVRAQQNNQTMNPTPNNQPNPVPPNPIMPNSNGFNMMRPPMAGKKVGGLTYAAFVLLALYVLVHSLLMYAYVDDFYRLIGGIKIASFWLFLSVVINIAVLASCIIFGAVKKKGAKSALLNMLSYPVFGIVCFIFGYVISYSMNASSAVYSAVGIINGSQFNMASIAVGAISYAVGTFFASIIWIIALILIIIRTVLESKARKNNYE